MNCVCFWWILIPEATLGKKLWLRWYAQSQVKVIITKIYSINQLRHSIFKIIVIYAHYCCSGRFLVLLITLYWLSLGENQPQHISTYTLYQLSNTVEEGWWFRLVLKPQTWALWTHDELLCTLKYSRLQRVCQLKLGPKWVVQQDNDTKRSSKSTTEWLKKRRIKELL